MNALFTRVHKFKNRLGPLWWHSGLMFAASRVGDFVGLYIGMFLVPAVMDPLKLGAVLPLLKFAAVVGVPMGIIARTAMKYISVLLVQGEHGKIKAMLRDLALLSSLVSVAIIISLSFGWHWIEVRLKLDDSRIMWLLAISVILSCWIPLAISISQGLKHFYRIILVRLLGPLARLAVAVLLLRQLQIVGYLSANLATGLVSLLLLGDGLLRYFRRDTPTEDYRALLPEMFAYAKPMALMTLMIALQLAAGPWIIRQRLPETVSAGYYMAAMFGNIPLWVAPAMLPFLFPLVSEKHERGHSTKKMHLQALWMVLLIGCGIALLLYFAGGVILNLRPAWREYSTYAVYMWQIALITTLDTFFQCHVTHESACSRFGFLRYYVPLVVVEIILLGVLMGWGTFHGVLPENLWSGVAWLVPVSLQSVLIIMLGMRLINFICLLASLRIKYSVQRLGSLDGRINH